MEAVFGRQVPGSSILEGGPWKQYSGGRSLEAGFWRKVPGSSILKVDPWRQYILEEDLLSSQECLRVVTGVIETNGENSPIHFW
jgi:hypothetical protein